MITITSALPNWNIKNKRIFLRADLNVPLHSGAIIDDYRLQAVQPTIDLILQKGGTVILATHLGRPQKPSEDLSTKQLVPWFKKRGYSIEYIPDLFSIHTKNLIRDNTIFLLENLRFFPEESSTLHTSNEKLTKDTFAKKLAQLGDYYVNDAFGTLHRNDTSLTLVPEYFSPEKRTIGLLIEKELTMLNKLLHNPKKPFVLLIGGGKIKDKIPVIQHLLDLVDIIMLCPATVFTFLHALSKPVGMSLIDTTMEHTANIILQKAKEQHVEILFPKDYVIAANTFTGPLSTVSAKEFPHNGVGISIGPKTVAEWSKIIHNAQTIFYAGLMGTVEKKDTLTQVKKIFEAMGTSSGLSIIGGGDSVAAVQLLGLKNSITFCSSGGGATLTYLAGKQLPGLRLFI